MAKAKEAREEARHEHLRPGQSRALTRRESLWPSESMRSPFSPSFMMNRFADEIDRLFGDFGLGRGRLSPRGWTERNFSDFEQSVWSPQLEVLERDGQFLIRADLPGLNKDDVKVEITDSAVTIQGERKQEHEEELSGWHRSERSYGSFYRSIPLPEGVNTDAVQARFSDGVLEIKMPAPTRDESRARRVDIK